MGWFDHQTYSIREGYGSLGNVSWTSKQSRFQTASFLPLGGDPWAKRSHPQFTFVVFGGEVFGGQTKRLKKNPEIPIGAGNKGYSKMDGENNGKPLIKMGWFGGTPIFGNTPIKDPSGFEYWRIHWVLRV